MEALLHLKSVLCDPEGRVCITGSDGDRNIVQNSIANIEQTIDRQAAQIEMLRKMLKQVCGSYLLEHPDTNIDPFVEALSSTPDQALEQFAAKVREQCAQMLLNGSFLHDQAPDKLLAAEAAKAIRAIKELPK